MSPGGGRGGGRGLGGGGRRRGQGFGRGGRGRGPWFGPGAGAGRQPRGVPDQQPAAPGGPAVSYDPIPDRQSRQKEIERLKRLAESIEHQKAGVEEAISDAESAQTERAPARPGAWRKPVVDAEACTGCGICLDVCPVDAIVVVDRVATISDDCTGCGACVDECPNGALSFPNAPSRRT
jgi:ferredoxin